MNLNMNNWIELLSIIQLAFFLEHKRPMQKIVNINSLNKRALNKIKLFKKHNKKNF